MKMGEENLIQGICKLCLKDKLLVNRSHIISKFFFEKFGFFNEHHKTQPIIFPIKINGIIKPYLELKKTKPIPNSYYEGEILYNECEGKIRDWENYLENILFKPNAKIKREVNITYFKNHFEVNGIDYTKLKLRILCNVWRTCISSMPMFKYAKPKQDIIEELRIMLDSSNVYSWYNFPIIINMISNTNGNGFLNPTVSNNILDIIFSKLEIYCILSMESQMNIANIKSYSPNENGTMSFMVNQSRDTIYNYLNLN